MERYTINKKIADGIVASVYKVTDKKSQNDTPLVLKEVECLDVTSAKNALDEYRLYHSFQNQSICQIHDCFIKWENKISSVFVCYLMDYFEQGVLKHKLNGMRSLKETAPIDVVEGWLGSMIDGLNLFHKNGLVHRNLKPSSLYMKTSKNGVSQLEIGDFGPYIIMKDIRTSTRVKSSVFNYQAPEIIDSHDFDNISDVWSIGAILLDICTTGIYDYRTFQMHLLNIRHDNDLFKEILRDIHKVYNSTPLLRLLKLMLNKDNQKRISLKSIINDDFIQQCLHEIGSSLVQVFADSTKKNVILPKERTIKATVSFISKIQSEKTMEAALERLLAITENEDFDLTIDENQNMLIGLISNFTKNLKIQTKVFTLMEKSIVTHIDNNLKLKNRNIEEKTDQMSINLNPKLIEKFFYLILEYDNSKDTLIQFTRMLIHFSHFEKIVDKLADFKVITYLLELINRYLDDVDVCATLCKTIWSLSSNDKIMRSLRNQHSLLKIRNVLIQHQTNLYCTEQACNVVIALTLNSKVILEEEVETDLTSALLLVLENHLDSVRVVNSCCMALAMMINLLDESSYRFLLLPASELNNEISGVDLLTEAYDRHKDKSEIVYSISNVFKELCNYEEILSEFKSISLHENLIADISQRFRDNVEISEACETIIMKIEESIKRDSDELALSNMQNKTKELWKRLRSNKNPAIF